MTVRFDLSDDQIQIRDVASAVLGKRIGPQQIRAAGDSGTFDPDLWAELRELGWPGLSVSDAAGGSGLGIVDLCVVLEQSAMRLGPAELLPTAAVASIVDRHGTEAQRASLVGPLLDGSLTASVGVDRGQADVTLVGPADAHVVVVAGPQGARLMSGSTSTPINLVDTLRPYSTIDSRGPAEPLADQSSAALDLLLTIGAADMLGLAQRALDLSVEHAQQREQFGRLIGSFQAVAHRCAQSFYAVEGARSTLYQAAWAAESDAEVRASAAPLAAATAIDAAQSVTASAIHVHGGSGFTREADIHWYYKRALVGAELWGTARWNRERFLTHTTTVSDPREGRG